MVTRSKPAADLGQSMVLPTLLHRLRDVMGGTKQFLGKGIGSKSVTIASNAIGRAIGGARSLKDEKRG